VLRRLSAGFAVIGDNQHLPGYCVLITDDPSADRLTDLPRERRLAFLADMDLLGEAVARVCARRDPGFRRINYEILGNLDAFLHAHVRPRYDWEPAELRSTTTRRRCGAIRRTPSGPRTTNCVRSSRRS
jgi:diadenosine tetraphosphate (Ap4A) HIT family hydrolase